MFHTEHVVCHILEAKPCPSHKTSLQNTALYAHTEQTLVFLCGLGPEKAQHSHTHTLPFHNLSGDNTPSPTTIITNLINIILLFFMSHTVYIPIPHCMSKFVINPPHPNYQILKIFG
jgi:hypothetical protein